MISKDFGASSAQSIERVIAWINQETMAALERVFPREPEKFFTKIFPEKMGEASESCLDWVRAYEALGRPVWEILERGGKGWRSYVIALSCEALGQEFGPYMDWLALPELIHVGSLIVDDVEDGSDLRRGDKTCHSIYGSALAINAGTFAYFSVQSLLDRTDLGDRVKLALYREYLSLLRVAHIGQGYDILGLKKVLSAGCPSDLVSLVRETHRLKSGYAFRTFARMGAWLGQGSSFQIDGLGRFFESVGIAFQIVDDVLNITGFDGNGKKLGEDIESRKITFPIALAVDRLTGVERDHLLKTFLSESHEEIDESWVLERIRKTGSIEASLSCAKKMISDAFQDLNKIIPESPRLDRLLKFATYMIERTY